MAPTAAGSPFNWAAPSEVATRLATLLGYANDQADQFNDYARSGVIDLDYGSATVLQWDVVGGDYWMNGVRETYAGGSATLTDNITNYVYIDTDGTLKALPSQSIAFTLPRLPLAIVTTSGGVVTAVQDVRRFITRQNSKHYVTVGGANNADFADLAAAVAWVRATHSTGIGENKPTIIQLLGNVTVPTMIDIDFPLFIEGSALHGSATPGIYAPAGSYAFRFLAGSSESRIRGVHCSMSQVTPGSGFFTVGTSQIDGVVIENCSFEGGNNDYAITLNAYTYAWRIQNNTFKDMKGTGTFIGGAGGGDRCQIQGNDFRMLTFTANHIDVEIVRSILSGNTITGGLHAIQLGGVGNKVQNNSLYGVTGYGVKTTAAHNHISDNYINAAVVSDDAILCSGDHTIVENNRIHEWVDGVGIWMDGAHSIISGNKLYGAPAVEATFGPGIFLDDSNAHGCLVRGNFIDMKPGASAGDGCDGAEGIDGGQNTYDNTITDNVVLNCGSTSVLGIGIRTGKESHVANNRVQNCRGNAYKFHGPGQIVTGNRAQDHGGGVDFLFDEDSSDQPTECIVTGNWAADPGGSFKGYGFTAGSTPADNRFWNNYGSTTMDVAKAGYHSSKQFYQAFNPSSQEWATAITELATYVPDDGYVGVIPSSWTLPAYESSNCQAGIKFYWSDGSVSYEMNATGGNVTTNRSDMRFQKNGLGIIGVGFVVNNTSSPVVHDFGPLIIEGDWV